MHDTQRNSRTSQYHLLDNSLADDNNGIRDKQSVFDNQAFTNDSEESGLHTPELFCRSCRIESKCGLFVCLALALVGLSSLLISLTSGYSAGRSKSQPEFVPPVPPHPGPYIFQLDPRWTAVPAGENGDIWDSLLGPNLGYVQVSRADARKYGLGRGIHESEDGTGTFELSVYHQLHCLARIREAFFDSHFANLTEHERQTRINHAIHCFDYLRQGIQCCGDTTVESAQADGRSIPGYDVSHWQCKDWTFIESFWEEHKPITYM